MKRATRGFTLVELAIVVTIIGLLIGGILKGQELLMNARVTTTIAEIKAIDAAMTTFFDTYNALPGDLANAATRLPNCTAGCNQTSGGSGNGYVFPLARQGDGMWGEPTRSAWASLEGESVPACRTAGNAPSAHLLYEMQLAWAHLNAAGLISGVSDVGLQQVTRYQAGVTHPANDLGGAFVVRTNYMPELPTGSTSTQPARRGQMLVLAANPCPDVASQITRRVFITPVAAAQLDAKMDDGRPTTGQIIAFDSNLTPAGSTCHATGADGAYNTATGGKVCGLAFYLTGVKF